MDKNTIRDDLAFRSKCVAYGLDWSEFNIYKDIIILNSPKKDILVLLDDNYNTIGIHKIEYNNQMQDIEKYAIKYRDLYNYVDYNNELNLLYPFQNFSLRQIVDLANRVNFYENHIIVNGKYVLDDHDNTYISLLAYIKFLGAQIEQYFLNAYQMKMLGFEYPEVHSYLKSIMVNIDECINMYIDKKTRPFPIDIIKHLGQDKNNAEKWNIELHKIIKLLLNEKGFNLVGGFEQYRDIETIEKREMNLVDLSLNLLKILKVPKDKIGENKLDFNMETINLQSWLEQDLDESKKLKLLIP